MTVFGSGRYDRHMRGAYRFLAFLMCVVLVVSICEIPAFATENIQINDESQEDQSVSGNCGESVTYYIDDGVLTIEGTGAMKDFASAYDVPWWEQRNSIQSVVFKGAITHIGERAFSMVHGCDTISFDGITSNFSIGERAFSNIPIESLDLPSNVTEVGNWAFEDAPQLKYVSIHGGTMIGNPFINAPKYEDEYLTVSFYNTADTKLEAHPNYETAIFGYNAYGKMMNLVFDDKDATDYYSRSIDWTHINDVYAPQGTLFSPHMQGKDAGCNVSYTIMEDDTAHITGIEKLEFTSQLYLPETILGHKITSVDCDIPTGLSVLHTGMPHVTGQDGVCALCGRQQYRIELDQENDKYLIHDFDELTDHYILELAEEYEIYVFELTEDFNLTSNKTFEIPEGCTLVIPENVTLTIESGADFVLDGTVIVEGGSIYNAGMIVGDGSFQGDGKFVTVPTEGTIWFVGEDDFYEGMPDFEIVFLYFIDWFDVEFEVVYDDEAIAESYYEKFTGAHEWQEQDPAKWTRVTDVSKYGIYHYVYKDPDTGKTVKKRFEVGKPYGKATITMADWFYGDTPPMPVFSSETNANADHVLYYKKASEGESAFATTVPSVPGEYTVRICYQGNQDYQQAVASADFSIKKRPVTIKIKDATRSYGASNPENYEYELAGGKGLVGGDTPETLGIVPNCTARADSDVGSYDILASVTSDCYDITIQKGTLTVTPIEAELTVDPAYRIYEKTFGDEPFMLEGIQKTGDGVITYAVDEDDKDVLAVSAAGEVTIKSAGEAVIHVTLPDTKNATGAEPVDITVKVAKAVPPAAEQVKLYYLRTQDNEIQIPLTEYLPMDCGSADFSGFDDTAGVTYTGCDESIAKTKPVIDEDGILRLTTGTSTTDCSLQISIPVVMQNYEDCTLVVTIHLVPRQETKLKDGESVDIRQNGIVYGNTLGSLTFADAVFVGKDTGEKVTGTLSFQNPAIKPEVGNGTYDADWVFTPDDRYNGLYDSCTGKVAVTVYQAEPEVLTLPVAPNQIYDPEKKLSMVPLFGGTAKVSGSWSWNTPQVSPTCGNSGYEAVFTPSNPNYKETIKKIPLVVEPASPTVQEKPEAAQISYGERLEASTLTGGKVVFRSTVSSNSLTYTIPGSFAWEDETILPTIADSNRTEYKIVFTPDDKNYAPVTTAVTVSVRKSGFAPGYKSGLQHIRVVNTVKKTEDVTGLPDAWKWADGDEQKTISQNDVCRATAVYDGSDKGNYEYETMQYEIYREPCQKGETVYYTLGSEVGPTCTKEGIGHRECELCHDTLETGVRTEALGHSYGTPDFQWSVSESNAAKTTAKAAFTCGRAGCDEAEAGHTVVSDCVVTHQVTDPDCETDGVIDYFAKVSFGGKKYEDTRQTVIPKLGHDYEPVYFDVVSDNSVSYNTAEKTCFVWAPNYRTCSVDFACTRCDKEETVTVKTGSQTTSTCTQDGIKTYTANVQFEGYELQDQKEVFDPATGHRLYNRELTKPTCTKPGYWTMRCITQGCRAVEKQEVPPLGHTGGTATCAHQAVCNRCGEAYGEPDPDNHEQDEIRNSLQQSCLADGYTGDTYCMACNQMLQSGQVIPQIGKHSWDDGIVVREATVLQNGQKKYTCQKCGAVCMQILYFEQPGDSGDVGGNGDNIQAEEKTDDQKENIYRVEEDKENPKKVTVVYVKPVTPKKVVVIPSTVTIGGESYAVTGIDRNAFTNDKTVTKVTIGGNITEIPKHCFSGCVNLKSVTIKDSVKKIGEKAFYRCKKLTVVKIGKNVTRIDSMAFAGCVKLRSVTIPSKVTTLGASIFYGDKNLKTIVIRSKKLTSQKMNKKTFRGVSKKVVIKVPKAKRKTYQTLFQKKGLSKQSKLKAL